MRAAHRNALDRRAQLWDDYQSAARRANPADQAGAESRSKMLDDIEHLSRQIETFETEERAERQMNGANPDERRGTAPRPDVDDGETRYFLDRDTLSRDAGWGRALRSDESFEALVRGTEREASGQNPPKLSLQKYLRGMVTGEWDGAAAERRAMAEGALATGGYMLPAPLSAQIIDLARNQTRVMQAGARLVAMPNKTLDVPRWESDPTFGWHSENALIAESDASLGRVRLDAKALASRVVASRELLEDAPGIEDELRDAFAQQLALTIDFAGLYGSGTAPEPRGVKNTAGITTLTTFGANGGTPTDYDFVIDALGALEDANETPTGIIWSGRTARTLAKLKDTTEQPLQLPQAVADVPRYATKQVPTNLTQGTSNDASDVFVADWRQLYIGLRTGLQIQVLSERYAENGQIGFLAWWRGDIAAARAKAFAVTPGVRA